MLLYEPYHHAFQQHFAFDSEAKEEDYMSSITDFSYESMPFSTDMFSTERQENKHDMIRSVSQGSLQQILPEAAPSLLYAASAPSIPSASSSTVGSPYLSHTLPVPAPSMYENYMGGPAILCDDTIFGYDASHFDHEATIGQDAKLAASFVDSGLLPNTLSSSYATYPANQVASPCSPAASPASSNSYHSFSQPMTVDNFSTSNVVLRRQSIASVKSCASPQSVHSFDEDREKTRCPYPDCGRAFKDLKAHMLTHERVRPEKCPILSCEYHVKGFARKYDKNRHTLTHYRGTMVCGFCPGSGSAAEKSFNRADVFKRHLTTVHGVEQAPPNSRKRSPSKSSIKLSSYCADATGKCSTCGASFNNAQEFYEHLDDCVLKMVQQEDPIEAVNAHRLGELTDDPDVQATFERNNIKREDSSQSLEDLDEDEEEADDDEDEEEEDELEFNERSGRGAIKLSKVTSNRAVIGGNISKKTSKKGLTWSKGGGSIIGKSRKRRKFYPPSWGMATDRMNMKKRVVCVYDGQRRLLKDDMMMHNEFEVRLPLRNGSSYVTDLDIETLKRSNAFHDATTEEKGPWIPENDFLQEFKDSWQ